MTRQNKLTDGSIFSSLARFALPFLAAAFMQQLYGTVDTLTVGQFSSDSAVGLSAITTGAQVINIFTMVVLGFCTGGTVLIGQYLGAGRGRDVRRAMGTMFPVLGITGLAITLILVLLAGPVVSVMQVPAAAVSQAREYLVICGAGFLFVTGYNMVSGILRGLGDSRTPMILVGIACVINIIGDLLLVGPLQMGVAGAAVSTIAAQGISFICSLFILHRRKDFPLRFRLKDFTLHREQGGLLLKLGAPIALQDFCVEVSFCLIAAFVNRLGLDQSACVGAGNRLVGIALLVAHAFLSAIAAMSAINMGNQQPGRAMQALKWGLLMSGVLSIILAGIIELFPAQLLGLFTSDPGVIEQGVLYTRTNVIDVALAPFVFGMNGFFSGTGHSSFSMGNCLISTFCVRVAGTLLVTLIPGTTMLHVGMAAPAASAVQIIIQLVYLNTGRWRRNGVLEGAAENRAIPGAGGDAPKHSVREENS